MTDMPSAVHINEEGPREGFQFEKGTIPTDRKIALIDSLSETGLKHIQIVSFVNPKAVPGMADAEAVVAGFHPRPGVAYSALWLNEKGFERAGASGRLDLKGSIILSASEAFLKRNQGRTPSEQIAAQHAMVERYKTAGVPIERAGIMAAFGCNFQGDIAPSVVADLAGRHVEIAAEHGVSFEYLLLADTMAWATPDSVKRVVSAVRDRFPDLEICLHLHDTRGMGIANAYAGLEIGVARFDASVAGLGGCPFAGHSGAAGNVCTEDLVFMCEEMGISTGVDLEKMLESARLAEEIVGHPLPGSVMRGGSLGARRRMLRAA